MITLQHREEISKSAACLLRRGGSSTLWAQVVSDIEAGRAHLYYVTNGSYLVLSVDNQELFIHACAGQHATVLMQLCIQVAQNNDCTSIRFRTEKKGLPRLLQRNFRLDFLGDNYYRVLI